MAAAAGSAMVSGQRGLSAACNSATLLLSAFLVGSAGTIETFKRPFCHFLKLVLILSASSEALVSIVMVYYIPKGNFFRFGAMRSIHIKQDPLHTVSKSSMYKQNQAILSHK